MSDHILTLKGVKKSYNLGRANQIDILNGIDLEIKQGEIIGLIGPSGAGKSTLLHICGLLDTPDVGEVELLGQPMQSATAAERTFIRRDDIGFIYQFHHLLPEFNALENVLIPQLARGLNYSMAHKRASDLLEWVGLSHRLHHRPAELSGGEQQRVAICRAVCNAPRFLLADEPTGNLDPKTSDYVFTTLLALLRDSGFSAIIATHNMELASRLDRRLTLQNGMLVSH